MKTRISLFVSLFLIVVISKSALGISGRHDKKESEYIKMAQEFTAVGQVIGFGTGVLIGEQWVLTAAHVVDFFDLLAPDPQKRFFKINGREYLISEVFVYPDHEKLTPQILAQTVKGENFNLHDIALLKLGTPVENIKPIPVYNGSKEVGSDVVIVGCGAFYNETDNPIDINKADKMPRGLLRAGTNKIDKIGTKVNTLELIFTAPDDDATEFEAGPFAGDSGGPLLIKENAKWYVAGIVSFASDDNNNFGTYGMKFFASRVSRYANWINKTSEKGEDFKMKNKET